MTVLWPNGSTTIPRVSSEFNPARRNPVTGVIQPHNGIDLIGWVVIVAPASGVVSFAGYNGTAGYEVRIKGDNGDTYRMLHNKSLWVSTGQRVARGQGVSVMGSTGQSTGDHCHFETRPGGGAPVNPRTYMAAANAGAAGGGSKPLPPKEEDDMFTDADREALQALVRDRGPSGGVQVYERINAGAQEFMVVAPTEFGKHPTDPKQDGYRITLDPTEARVWARQYSGADKVPTHVERGDYIAAQEWARARAAEYRELIKQLIREVLAEPGAHGAG